MDKILKFKLAKLSSMLWRDTIKYIYYQHGLRNDNKGGFKLHERGKLVSIFFGLWTYRKYSYKDEEFLEIRAKEVVSLMNRIIQATRELYKLNGGWSNDNKFIKENWGEIGIREEAVFSSPRECLAEWSSLSKKEKKEIEDYMPITEWSEVEKGVMTWLDFEGNKKPKSQD